MLAMDFKLEDEEEESDYDMNSMDVDEAPTKKKTDITHEKRKAEVKYFFFFK